MGIFELNVPGETRIKIAHDLKFEKYQHFCTDIQTIKVAVHPFEVGSHTGYLSRENKDRLKKLQNFAKTTSNLKN